MRVQHVIFAALRAKFGEPIKCGKARRIVTVLGTIEDLPRKAGGNQRPKELRHGAGNSNGVVDGSLRAREPGAPSDGPDWHLPWGNLRRHVHVGGSLTQTI